jgi:hypothetical protein
MHMVRRACTLALPGLYTAAQMARNVNIQLIDKERRCG